MEMPFPHSHIPTLGCRGREGPLRAKLADLASGDGGPRRRGGVAQAPKELSQQNVGSPLVGRMGRPLFFFPGERLARWEKRGFHWKWLEWLVILYVVAVDGSCSSEGPSDQTLLPRVF